MLARIEPPREELAVLKCWKCGVLEVLEGRVLAVWSVGNVECWQCWSVGSVEVWIRIEPPRLQPVPESFKRFPKTTNKK